MFVNIDTVKSFLEKKRAELHKEAMRNEIRIKEEIEKRERLLKVAASLRVRLADPSDNSFPLEEAVMLCDLCEYL